MQPSGGYIKLHRKFLSWQWYDDHITKAVYLHCLLKASFKSSLWHGRQVEKGQLIISLRTMAKELQISIQQLRTSLKRLEESGEITISSTNMNTLITVCDWEHTQKKSSALNHEKTDKKKPSRSFAAYDLSLFEEMLNRDD